jgi:L-iditol 2-dehydrogenase
MIPEKMNSIVFNASPVRWVTCKVLGLAWPGVYLSSLSGVRCREMPTPKLPAPDWVLCRTLLGGICGTDLNFVYLRQHPASLLQRYTSWPVSLGHENVAQIVDAGPGIKEFHAGQRIIVDPPIPCSARKIDPVCPSCREGKPALCWNLDRGSLPPGLGLGYNNFTGGTWSPYFVAHQSQLHLLPDEIPDEQAILIDPISCSLHAVLHQLPAASEKILVFGSGIIGLGVIMALRALDLPVEITATVRHPFQADLAKKCGADHVVFWKNDDLDTAMGKLAAITGAGNIVTTRPIKTRFLQGGFDRLYDCTGKPAGLIHALRLIRSGGKLIITGTPQLGLMDMTCSWFRELTILGVTGRCLEVLPGQSAPRHNYEHLIGLLLEKKINLSPLPVTLYRQEEFHQALAGRPARAKNHIIKSAFDFR